mgnify:CR=1 FL=1
MGEKRHCERLWKTTVISEGQSASTGGRRRARNLRATWIRAAFNPPDELAIMRLGWVRW